MLSKTPATPAVQDIADPDASGAASYKQTRCCEQGLKRVRESDRMVARTPLCAIGGIPGEHTLIVFTAGALLFWVFTEVKCNQNPEGLVPRWRAVSG
jgi:thiamine monophosphate synthase